MLRVHMALQRENLKPLEWAHSNFLCTVENKKCIWYIKYVMSTWDLKYEFCLQQ